MANPIAQILSAAMMVKYSFGMDEGYDAIFGAINSVLDDGFRTGDIAGEGDTVIGTEEMGKKIARAVTG